MRAALYDLSFYDNQAPGSQQSAAVTVPLVLELLHPESVVDVGCGVGTWLNEFLANGVSNVLGIDGDYVDRSSLRIPGDMFFPADLTQPIHFEQRYDLAVSLEVAEHLPETAARRFVQSLTDLSPVVLFSAAIPHQGGHLHINEQWPDYWANLFRDRGYLAIDCIRPRIWTNQNVRWWYAQNAILYVDETHLKQSPDLVALHERFGGTPLPLVHPRTYLKHVERYTEERARSAFEVGARSARARIPQPAKSAIRKGMSLRPGLTRREHS